jgi:hypothetical protein
MTGGGMLVAAGVLVVLAIGVLSYLAERERTDREAGVREGYRHGSWFLPRRAAAAAFTERGWRYARIAHALTYLFWAGFAAWVVLRLTG